MLTYPTASCVELLTTKRFMHWHYLLFCLFSMGKEKECQGLFYVLLA